MTSDEAPEQPLPAFFTEWRDGFGPNAADFSPLDYLNQEAAVPFVIAAQWLFCPSFTEYRGCVVVVKGGTDTGELAEHDKAIIDEWFTVFDGDRPKIEFKVNLLSMDGLFASVDSTPFDDELAGLARAVAECWAGLLAVRYPERRFAVEVFDDDSSPSGPEITFYSQEG